jgi:hypothetical protein
MDATARDLLSAIDAYRGAHQHDPAFKAIEPQLGELERNVRTDAGGQEPPTSPGMMAAQNAAAGSSSGQGHELPAALAAHESKGGPSSEPALASGATKDKARAAMGGADSATGASSLPPFLQRQRRRGSATAQKGQ